MPSTNQGEGSQEEPDCALASRLQSWENIDLSVQATVPDLAHGPNDTEGWHVLSPFSGPGAV